jgi:CelD/BcsL family acetyltransferase involved in cellulose biosynthesis
MDDSKHAFDVRIENAFDFLSPEYAALFNGSAATAFQHPIWLDGLYGKLVPKTGANPLIVVIHDRASGTLSMVLPLVRVRRGPIRTVEFADLRVSDYLVPVCTEEMFSHLLRDEYACRQIRRIVGRFDLLRMPKLPDGRIPVENLLGAPRRVAMDINAYSTVLVAPFEQWRANALDRSYQKELAKKWRQLQKKGTLSFSCCEDSASIAAAMDVMRKLRGPRFQAQGDGDLLQRPEYFDFYSDVATRGLGSFVRLYAMKLDGNVIAAVLGLHHGDRLLIIMSAFDIAGFKNQSLGALTFEQVAKDCIERGDRILDFTIGD